MNGRVSPSSSADCGGGTARSTALPRQPNYSSRAVQVRETLSQLLYKTLKPFLAIVLLLFFRVLGSLLLHKLTVTDRVNLSSFFMVLLFEASLNLSKLFYSSSSCL